MKGKEQPKVFPPRMHLSKGERLPETRPSSIVNWPDGKPPGGPLPPQAELPKPTES